MWELAPGRKSVKQVVNVTFPPALSQPLLTLFSRRWISSPTSVLIVRRFCLLACFLNFLACVVCFHLVDSRLDFFFSWRQFPKWPMKEPLLQGNLLFFLLTETLVLLTSLLWVFRSHYWITSMVVFHSGNPKSSKCFSHKHFPPRTFMAFYSQALGYYVTSVECEKGLFRAQLGLLTSLTMQDWARIWCQIDLGADPLVVGRPTSFINAPFGRRAGFAPHSRAYAPDVWRYGAHARVFHGRDELLNFLAILYSFAPFVVLWS